MESTDSSTGSQQPNLPPGFRFHPTDEELVVHYLKKKASSAPLPVAIIAEVDLYKFDPWELPAKATFGEQEWYFFSPRDRKYPNGARPNRAATSGYWKATGTDKPVLTSGGTQKVGVKKALVFYGGKPPKGIKTNWIMHEYRLADNKVSNKPPGCDLGSKKNSLRLDDWVLCRIYKKNNIARPIDHDKDDSMDDMLGLIPPSMMVSSQHNPKLHLSSTKGMMNMTSYGALLESDHQNLFEGMMSHDHHHHHHHNGGSMSSLATTSSSKLPQLTMDSLKRTLPSSMNWTDDQDTAAGPQLSKRFHGESNNNDDGNISIDRRTDHGNGGGSIATLLSQLPQTPPPLHQQALLGSLGDGIFRQPYHQLPGMNWYT
ncbi:hypothetical protein Dsin_022529 [Dipteronia sinensis]|uniref:NAC domain-containing protein n=1 Tax=Dipteronia sinensis TaxID=43782 RepID=A0AAE0A1R1_9ROSI|nr:hypothetical protein Dsin_022529 [Dipteronia sinensis]